MCVWKEEYKRKRGRGWPIFKKESFKPVSQTQLNHSRESFIRQWRCMPSLSLFLSLSLISASILDVSVRVVCFGGALRSVWPDSWITLLYLAIYNNENFPNRIIFWQNMFTNLPGTKLTFKILPKTLYILPKWRNFAKSGRAGHDRALRRRIYGVDEK